MLQVSDPHLSGASYEWSAPLQSTPGGRGAPRSNRGVHNTDGVSSQPDLQLQRQALMTPGS